MQCCTLLHTIFAMSILHTMQYISAGLLTWQLINFREQITPLCPSETRMDIATIFDCPSNMNSFTVRICIYAQRQQEALDSCFAEELTYTRHVFTCFFVRLFPINAQTIHWTSLLKFLFSTRKQHALLIKFFTGKIFHFFQN